MNTNMMNFEIVSGPNRDALYDAFKYAYDKSSVIAVNFNVSLGRIGDGFNPMKCKDFKITSIEHEDGSGYSFNIKGYCLADARYIRDVVTYLPYKFKAYYNAKTRKGSITLESKN